MIYTFMVHATVCVVHLANIKFGDLGRKTDWRIFSLGNKLIHFRLRDIMLMAAETYKQCVRGHHIYKREWVPFIGEELYAIEKSET